MIRVTASAAVALAALFSGACSFDSSGLGPEDDGGQGVVDAASNSDGGAPADAGVGPDSANPPADAAPPADGFPPAVGDHLLITEVRGAGTSGEFVEIYNPTATPIALDNYYLSDHMDYAFLPAFGTVDGPNISGPYDFLARFPPGNVILPRQVMTIALNAGAYFVAYGKSADFSINGTAFPPTQSMVPIIVGATTLFTDTGEAVILFFWDGQSDLVKDVDITVAGDDPSDTNMPGDKTDLQVDGPDNGAARSTYADDADTIDALDSRGDGGTSYKRIALEGDAEIHNGTGNGITGHDETSENIRKTWDNTNFTIPTPGDVPTALNP